MNRLLLACELIGLAIGAEKAVSGGVSEWAMFLVLIVVIMYGRRGPTGLILRNRNGKEVNPVNIFIDICGGEGSTDDPRRH
ncbi:hypothetical protein GZH49_28600 [Nocardia terpenica]|uniref:hypothetical protein n=1 Tax=Nocardia terpenica TaxID=455432 RepID=UPI002FE3D8DE